MSDVKGFLALSIGPLIMSALVLIALTGLFVAGRAPSLRRTKWFAGGAIAVVVTLIPTWDVIAGRFYFSYLCATDSGMRIYKKVQLGSEHRDPKPFPDSSIQYSQTPLSKPYPYRSSSVDDLPGPARIKVSRRAIVEAKSGNVLGEITEYYYRGGWFENATSLGPVQGISCTPDQSLKSLLEKIFPSAS